MLILQDDLIASLLEALPLRDEAHLQQFVNLVGSLHGYQQRAVQLAMLNYLNNHYLAGMSRPNDLTQDQRSSVVGDCAALIKSTVASNRNLTDYLSELCINVEISVLTRSLGLRRLALAVLCDDEGGYYPCLRTWLR